MNIRLVACCLLLVAAGYAADQSKPATAKSAPTFSAADIQAVYPDVEALYLDLHRNPELGFQEQQSSAKLAERLRGLGYEVTTGVGKTGVVGVMKNGAGPTVLLRTDMDALPVAEKTGLPYASSVTVKNASGSTIPVMHACGHDVHMSSWYGTAKLLASNRQRWHGTLVLIGQPAEELGEGASAMLKDGLFTRFPKPDFALAIHDDSSLPAGVVGYTPGPALASADTVYITIFGKGGHGAMPQTTVDPVVIAARTVLALQTIVSRENDPRDPAVITVGSIHGGTRENVIPDQVKLAITVRSYKDEVRKKLLSAIDRVAKAEALAANAPHPPQVDVEMGLHPTVNDPALTNRMAAALRRSLGEANVREIPPKMVSEDFGEFALAGVPSTMFHVGGVEPQRWEAAMKAGETLPSLHSAQWAPDREPTLKTAIATETTMVLELMGK